MEKLDLTKKHKAYYTAKTKPELVTIEEVTCLAIRGKGDPSEQGFAQCVQAMYSVAYTLKFACKARVADFAVAKLQGQWWYDEEKYAGISMQDAPVRIPRSEWEYRLLIRMPDYITQQDLDNAINTVVEKKGIILARALSLYTLTEGKCVQMLHVGPYATEIDTLLVMKEYMEQHKLQRNGLHHEIYLSDMRKTAPEKLKTILREPVK